MSGTELEQYEPLAPATLFGARNAREVVKQSTDVADALTDVIQKRKLYANIQGKSHVLVEAWCLLGSMLGVFPIVVWTRRLEEGGWEARVEARTLSGQVVGAAEAQCTRQENAWSENPTGKGGKKLPPRDDYALRSMAQTRATSKALRGPLGFIVHLAGFNPTPAEEMPEDVVEGTATEAPAKATQAQHAKLNAMCADLDKAENPALRRADGLTWEDYSKRQALDNFGCESRADLSKDQMSALIQLVKDESEPFG